jgi:hypothetical protein
MDLHRNRHASQARFQGSGLPIEGTLASDIAEVANASIRLINKKWTVHELRQDSPYSCGDEA